MGLTFYPKENILVCRSCKVLLRNGFYDHVKKFHNGLQFKQEDINYVKGNYLKGTCAYDDPIGKTLPRINFLPVIPGFYCVACNRSMRHELSIKKHISKSCPNSQYLPCFVQNIGFGSYAQYFKVSNYVETVGVITNSGVFDTEGLCRKLIGKLKVEPVQETNHQLGFFYRNQLWFEHWFAEGRLYGF